MTSPAPSLIPQAPTVMAVDPPGVCRICCGQVPEVVAQWVVRSRPGERRQGTVEVLLSVASMVVAAWPCGHVVYQRGEDGADASG